MQKITRRTFLTRTSLGVAAVGAMATIPGAGVLAATRRKGQAAPLGAAIAAGHLTRSGPLVITIPDPRDGSLSFFSGESEVTRHDPQLVANLLRSLA